MSVTGLDAKPDRWSRAKRVRSAVMAAAVAAAVLVPATAPAATKVHSQALANAVVLDGEAGDWEGIPQVYLEESVRVLGIAHDAENLYLMFRFSDERLARKILVGGVTVWVDGDNKKKQSFGVRYQGSKQLAESIALPRPAMDEGDRPPGGRRPGGDERPMPRRRREPGTLTVLVDEGAASETFPEDLPGGPQAASAFADGVYVFELAIPIDTVGGKAAARPAGSKRTLKLGLQIGGLSKHEREEMRDAMGGGKGGFSGSFGGMGGGGRGGGMGGRGGGERGGPDGGGMRKMMEESKPVWLEVRLDPVTARAEVAGQEVEDAPVS